MVDGFKQSLLIWPKAGRIHGDIKKMSPRLPQEALLGFGAGVHTFGARLHKCRAALRVFSIVGGLGRMVLFLGFLILELGFVVLGLGYVAGATRHRL